MVDESPFYILELPSDAPPLRFQTADQFRDWLDAEITKWSWLWEGGEFTHYRNTLNRLTNLVAEDGFVMHDFRNQISEAFDSHKSNAVFRSDSEKGTHILGMHEQMGAAIARIGFSIERNAFSFGQPIEAVTLRNAIAAISFDAAEQSKLGERLKAERKNYRNSISKLENRVRELEHEKRLNDDLSRSRRRRHLRHLFEIGRAHVSATESEAQKKLRLALTNFAETEDTYRKQMALLAPVEYWNEKAKSHGKWEIGYGFACATYFILAGILIATFATRAIDFLKGDQDASAYVIIAGALLGGTTLVFWVGRILVKLFLSEHHLRTDCKEKAIMTQSFLSMVKDVEFSAEHRAIVLASIFRSSPDGIVKEEGPADVGLHALLARVISQR